MLSDIIPIGSRPTNAATSTGRTPGSASTVANRPRPARDVVTSDRVLGELRVLALEQALRLVRGPLDQAR